MFNSVDHTLVMDCRLVEVVERLAIGDAADSLGEKPVAGEDTNFRRFTFQRDCIADHKFFEFRVFDFLDGIAGKDRMGNHGTDTLGTAGFDDS